MKIKRVLLAAALTLSATACTGDPTGPEPALRRPGVVPPSTSETSEPVIVSPVAEPMADDGGGVGGSGCCAKG